MIMSMISTKFTAEAINETLIGIALLAIAVFAIWLLGYVAEPHLQWLNSVAELQQHAWYSKSASPSTGIGRSLYVGVSVLMGLALIAAITMLTLGILFWLRDLGYWVRQREKQESQT